MAERSNARDSKSRLPFRVTRVQIPFSPPNYGACSEPKQKREAELLLFFFFVNFAAPALRSGMRAPTA